MAQAQKPEGLITIPLGGMNEEAVPEFTVEDLIFIQGLIPNQKGELIKQPGKLKLTRQGVLPILTITQFGDTVYVENAQQLVKYSNAELFGGTETEPTLYPDDPIETLTEEEENMAITLLKYRVASGVAAANVSATTWTTVPFSNEDADTGANCSLAGSGEFTLSSSVYPVEVRFEAQVDFYPSASGSYSGQLMLETTAGTFVAAGLNAHCMRTIVSAVHYPSGMNLALICRFTLAASTAYRLRIRTTGAGTMGQTISSGNQEVYAQAKLLFEPTTVPCADGTVTPVTSITTEDGIITAIS